MRPVAALLILGCLFACRESERADDASTHAATVAADNDNPIRADALTRLQFRYEHNAFGSVNAVTASEGGAVVATARKIGSRSAGGPMVTDVEVEETHFEPGTPRVIYRGRIVFRCRTNEPFGEPIESRALSGQRSRVIFDRWPYATSPSPFGA